MNWLKVIIEECLNSLVMRVMEKSQYKHYDSKILFTELLVESVTLIIDMTLCRAMESKRCGRHAH